MNKDPMFKVAIIGPSRVGKTSLITALFKETEAVLLGQPMSIVAKGPTKGRLHHHLNELRGSIAFGKFNPGALGGTQSSTQFDLELKTEDAADVSLQFSILDFPGGWLSRPEGRDEKEWARCEAWIKDSPVLLVPIDATVLMEAVTSQEFSKIGELLQLQATQEVATMWAKARCEANAPALLLLAPVKCESYFADRFVNPDRSRELYQRVVHETSYGEMLRNVQQVFEKWHRGSRSHNLAIHFHPIDTVGCVSVMDAKWFPEFSASYRVHPGGKFSPYGAGGILIAICRQIAEWGRADRKVKGEQILGDWANRGLFSGLWAFLSGKEKVEKEELKRLEAQIVALNRVIDFLSKQEFTQRVKVEKSADLGAPAR